MNPVRIVAIVLIVVGALALIYGGFSYISNTKPVKLGKLEISVKEKKTVSVPVWAGVVAIALGGVLLFVKRRSST